MDQKNFLASPIATISSFTIAFFAAAVAGISFALSSDDSSIIWVANAIAIGLLLRTPVNLWPLAMGAVLVAGSLAAIVSGIPVATSVVLTGFDVVEIIVAALLIRRWCGPNVHLDSNIFTYLRVLGVAAVLAPAISTGLAASIFFVSGFEVPLFSPVAWFVSSAIGAIILLPVMLSADKRMARAAWTGRPAIEFLLITALIIGVTYLALRTLDHPFVVVALGMVLASTRLVPLATATLSAITFVTIEFVGHFAYAGGPLTSAIGAALSERASAAIVFIAPFAISLLFAKLRADRAELVDSEERFRSTMEYSAIGVALTSLDGRFLRVNPATCRLFGYSAEELSGMAFRDITHADDLPINTDLAKKTLSGEIDSFRLEKRYVRKDGSIVWALLVVAVVRDVETGEPLHFVSQFEDITDRKQTEAKLAASERRWAFALEGGRQGVWDYDIKADSTYYSPTWCQMLGYDHKTFGNDPGAWKALIHPADLQNVIVSDRQHLEGKTPFSQAEFRMRHKDGHWVWILDQGQVMERDADGSPLRLIGTYTDISGLKEAEAALAESESRWAFALESARQGVWDKNLVTGKTFYSPVWKDLLGYADDEIDDETSNWEDYVHPDDREIAPAATRAYLAGTKPIIECEFRMRHKSGRWVWILDRGKVIEHDAEGKPTRMIGTHTDITQQKNAEQELTRLNDVVEAEKELLRVTLASIGDAVICTDQEQVITFMNTAAANLTGWAPNEAIRQPVGQVLKLLQEGTGEPARQPVEQCLETSQVVSISAGLLLATRSGDTMDIRATVSPVKSDESDSVIGTVVVFQDITPERLAHRRIAHFASHDALTGLNNRTTFEDELEEACLEIQIAGSQHSVCFIDLDRFKTVNDRAGHAAGDALLREVATLIRAGVRSADTCARLGGDEFGLILKDCNAEQAKGIGNTLIGAIRDIGFKWEDETFDIGACVGVAEIREGDTPAEVLRQADVACYAAKSAGRNRTHAYDPEIGHAKWPENNLPPSVA